MLWSLAIVTVCFAFSIWSLISLLLNYYKARKTGLPIIFSPVFSQSIFWLLFHRQLIPLWRLLPEMLSKCTRCNYIGWQFEDKFALHKELGPAFMVVNPTKNELILADADAVSSVFSQRTRFIKPPEMYAPMNIFGPNVNTIEGEEWAVHRKVTNSAFNENTIREVWSEGLAQANEMLQSWSAQGSSGVVSTVDDTATVALHVLTKAGFGLKYSFQKGVSQTAEGYELSYRDALQSCLKNIIFLAIFPDKFLSWPYFPGPMRKIGEASRQLRMHMQQMIANVKQGDHGSTNNLVSAVVRVSEEGDGQGRRLTDEEVQGNVFMYNLAGHETTANAVAYATVLLAIYPEWQRWLAEEVRQVLAGNSDPDTWSFSDTFPQLKRCMAVMYETLRLYPSTPFVPKSTGFHAQSLCIEGKEVQIPDDTYIYINTQALHCNPQTWGDDVLEWRPSRWLSQDKTSGEERFIETPKGTYIPWADGPRSCPGRRFAQVEFVGIMATLFREHIVEPVKSPHEDEVAVRHRLKSVVDDSAIFAITLQMKEPRSIALAWRRDKLTKQ